MRIKSSIIDLLIILCVVVILVRIMTYKYIKFPFFHRLSTDPYYEEIADKVIVQKLEWEKELGFEQGVRKTVDWVNGKLIDSPAPLEISEAIKKAEVDESNPRQMWLYFSDENNIVWHFPGQEPYFYISSCHSEIIKAKSGKIQR